MRVRLFRWEDSEALIHIQQAVQHHDGIPVDEHTTISMLPANDDTTSNTFVITDDDDELNTWGQAGTLEGIEGEIVGYTTLQLFQDVQGYHFLCQGAVHPHYRRQNGGRLLLVSALNRARFLATEFEFEAEQAGLPLYFEALLPANDPASARLASRYGMTATHEGTAPGLRLYRCEL